MSAYDFIDTLAVQILTYKKEHNETAAQFAKGCGVSATTIRRIENGDANVKLSTADKLLRYMNITLIDLLPPLATESPIAEGKERPRNKEATPAPQGEVAEKKILFSELLANNGIPVRRVYFLHDIGPAFQPGPNGGAVFPSHFLTDGGAARAADPTQILQLEGTAG